MTISWTQEEKDILKKLTDKGCSIAEITKVLKSRNSNAIKNYCYKYDLPVNRSMPEINIEEFNRLMRGK